VPYREYSDLVIERNVVDVIPAAPQQYATSGANGRASVQMPDQGRAADEVEGCRNLVQEQI
jgi:hypothetical protein